MLAVIGCAKFVGKQLGVVNSAECLSNGGLGIGGGHFGYRSVTGRNVEHEVGVYGSTCLTVLYRIFSLRSGVAL